MSMVSLMSYSTLLFEARVIHDVEALMVAGLSLNVWSRGKEY
jgi:hypothetical protein